MPDENKEIVEKSFNDDALSQRLALADRYAKSAGGITPEQKSAEAPPESKKEEPPAAPAEPPSDKKSDTEPEPKPDAGTTPEAKTEERVRMVPHAALHEEREKHKATKLKVDELQSQLNTVLQDVKSLMEKKKAEGKDEDSGGDDIVLKSELRVLMDENNALKKRLTDIEENQKQRAQYEQTEAQKRQADLLRVRIDSAHEELDKEGFPGFKQFTPLITNELVRLINEDEANKHLDNPDGWKKIYKETVFPTVKKTLAEQKKEDKIALKQEANLAASPGSRPPQEKKEDEDRFTVEDYMKLRKKHLVT